MAGILLTYMDMEDAFCCLMGILKGYKMRDFFLPKMPGLHRSFYIHLVLMKKYLPKLYAHFNEVGFIPSMYGSGWFMTIFANQISFECSLRIWDIFVLEGRKIIYRVALAIFKIN